MIYWILIYKLYWSIIKIFVEVYINIMYIPQPFYFYILFIFLRYTSDKNLNNQIVYPNVDFY